MISLRNRRNTTAGDLSSQLAPFSLLCNRNALAPAYRALYISDHLISGRSTFGKMDVSVELGIKGECYVDADSFLQVLRSLPDTELELDLQDTVLKWKCGNARGSIALFAEKVVHDSLVWEQDLHFTLPSEFPRRLELGAVACGSSAYASLGLFGVMFVNSRAGLICCASDNDTISTVNLCDPVPDAGDRFVLDPDAVRVLRSVVLQGGARIGFDKDFVWCSTPSSRLVLLTKPALRHDIYELRTKFEADKIKLPVNKDVIQAFVKRADALAEDRGKSKVQISVEGGVTKLSFSEGLAQSEEFYLVEGAGDINVDPIELEAKRLSRALTGAPEIVYDYAADSILVLRGPDDFMFTIIGHKG